MLSSPDSQKPPHRNRYKKQIAGPGNGETPPLPDMFLKNSEYDVGEVYEGTPVTHTFIITNRGKGDLVIQSVKPG